MLFDARPAGQPDRSRLHRCLAYVLSRGLVSLFLGLLLGTSTELAAPRLSFSDDGELILPAAGVPGFIPAPAEDDPPDDPPTQPNVLCPCAAL